MPFIKFDNKRVYYKIKGKGEQVLLLHGNSVSSRMFSTLINKYSRVFQVILVDFPGHGKSERLKEFKTDFWFYNSMAVNALIEELKIDKVSVIGTSGGALVAINLALEYPNKIKYLIADSFEGEFPLPSYIESIESDRGKDKKKLLAKLIWWYCHGWDWRKIVDMDTKVNLEFSGTGKSFFHRSISELKVPTLLTGSLKDEYCEHLDQIYADLKRKNEILEIHMFDKGNHPAMISNMSGYFELVKSKLNA